jgi:hypothetical protein
MRTDERILRDLLGIGMVAQKAKYERLNVHAVSRHDFLKGRFVALIVSANEVYINQRLGPAGADSRSPCPFNGLKPRLDRDRLLRIRGYRSVAAGMLVNSHCGK